VSLSLFFFDTASGFSLREELPISCQTSTPRVLLHSNLPTSLPLSYADRSFELIYEKFRCYLTSACARCFSLSFETTHSRLPPHCYFRLRGLQIWCFRCLSFLWSPFSPPLLQHACSALRDITLTQDMSFSRLSRDDVPFFILRYSGSYAKRSDPPESYFPSWRFLAPPPPLPPLLKPLFCNSFSEYVHVIRLACLPLVFPPCIPRPFKRVCSL